MLEIKSRNKKFNYLPWHFMRILVTFDFDAVF